MIVDRDMLQNHKIPFAIFLTQLVLAFLAVYQFLALIGFSFNVSTRHVSFGFSEDPFVYVFFVLILLMLYALYSMTRKKYEDVFVATSLIPFQFKSTTKFKLWLGKNEPRVAALLLIQFAFIAVVVMALYAYLDPDLSVVQWQKFGIYDPWTTVLNVALFLIVVGVFHWLYSFTSLYRSEREQVSQEASSRKPLKRKK